MVEPFPNVGNICYFNALLQCVNSSLRRRRLLKQDSPEPANIYTLRDVMSRLAKKNIQPPRFRDQHCAGEMFTLMTTAYEEFPKFANKFFYELTTSIICSGCLHEKKIYERENIFHIENRAAHITEFLSSTESIEIRCDRCPSTRAIRKTSLRKEAPVMVFQVKINNEKNKVGFPPRINVNGRIWTAAAFIHHYGNNEGGHVVAAVHVNEEWWIADDASVVNGVLPQESIQMAFYTTY